MLGQAQRPAGVARKQRALGDGGVGLEVDGRRGHGSRHGTRLSPPMAKKDKKKAKKEAKPADPVGAVRTAVERTFQATAGSAQSTRTRAQDLVDEVAGAAGRVREMIEDVRVLEDLKGLRTEVEALRTRVAALEAAPPAKAPAPKRATSRGRAAKPASRGRAAKPAAATARSSAGRKPAATSKGAATATRSSAGRKSSAGQRKPSA